MTSFFKTMTIFFILLVATSVAMDVFKLDFGTTDYWTNHGFAFLVFISLFPRLTLLFSSVASGGFLWWLGFIFCPRILVALLATVAYFHTNPILVVISWFVAISGELFEKLGLKKSRSKFIFRSYRSGQEQYHPQPQTPIESKGDAIEAEFKKY